MTSLATFAIAAGLLAALLANIAIWSPRRLRIKLAALAAAACFLPLAYGGFAELLGRPKPLALEWKRSDLGDAAVLGARLDEGEAIYLWLGLEQLPEPLSYVLPWDEDLAKQLHAAQRQAEEQGTDLRMRGPFETSTEKDEPLFYALPQPAPNPKSVPAGDTLWFQEPTAGAEGDSG